MELFSQIVEILSSISTIIASVFAIYAIKSWKKEKKIFVETRKIELAEEVLELFYKAIDIIGYMRKPFSWNDEGAERPKLSYEKAGLIKLLDSYYVPKVRYLEHSDTFDRIKALSYRCKARLGDTAYESFDKLHEITNEIFLAVDNIIDTTRDNESRFDNLSEEAKKQYFAKKHELEAIIWQWGKIKSGNNLINNKIKELEECLDKTFGELILDKAKQKRK